MEPNDPTRVIVKQEAGLERRNGADDIKITSESRRNVVIRRNPISRNRRTGAVSHDIGSIALENSYGSGQAL